LHQTVPLTRVGARIIGVAFAQTIETTIVPGAFGKGVGESNIDPIQSCLGRGFEARRGNDPTRGPSVKDGVFVSRAINAWTASDGWRVENTNPDVVEGLAALRRPTVGCGQASSVVHVKTLASDLAFAGWAVNGFGTLNRGVYTGIDGSRRRVRLNGDFHIGYGGSRCGFVIAAHKHRENAAQR
jgi:hypothetical protein